MKKTSLIRYALLALLPLCLITLPRTLQVRTSAQIRPPEFEPIDAFLATPANGYLWEMPVVIIRYLPTLDGGNVDQVERGFRASLTPLKRQIDRFNKRIKFMLEEGSRSHGYEDPFARPSLGYRVVRIITVYEALPPEFAALGTHGSGPSVSQGSSALEINDRICPLTPSGIGPAQRCRPSQVISASFLKKTRRPRTFSANSSLSIEAQQCGD